MVFALTINAGHYSTLFAIGARARTTSAEILPAEPADRNRGPIIDIQPIPRVISYAPSRNMISVRNASPPVGSLIDVSA
jgi:hypothetical protein